jgi:membrane-associated PAP2 superfamily phosphatase
MSNGGWSYIFSFGKLIAPKIIWLIYMAGLVVGVITGLVGITRGFNFLSFNAALGLGTILLSLLLTALGLLAWRILCEFYIVFFGIYDRLGEIKNSTGAMSTSLRDPATEKK